MQKIVIAKLAVYTEAANHSGYMKIIKTTTANFFKFMLLI